VQAIKTRQLEFPAWLSPAARDFLRQALQRDPQLRPTSSQLLVHPFIVAHNTRRRPAPGSSVLAA
jgi:aurora kinase